MDLFQNVSLGHWYFKADEGGLGGNGIIMWSGIEIDWNLHLKDPYTDDQSKRPLWCADVTCSQPYFVPRSSHWKVIMKVCRTVASDSAIPWTVARQAPLSMEFSRLEYWSGLPFPSPGDLPNPGIKPGSPVLQADSLPIELLVTLL